ncbi:MAG TPA: hypothetical protein VEH08_05910 [Methanomassiliicoccales archaeon]|nr:hypothetical protein [Methanomassiliicoccales archaeon]
MLATTHLLFVILVILWLNLDRYEILAVLTFGVFIDLDHLLALPGYVAQTGLANALNPDAAMTSGVVWKSILHNPMCAVVIGPLSLGFRYALPFVVWGAHLFMDWVQMTYLGVASPTEMALCALMLAAIGHLEHQKYAAIGPRPRSLMTFFSWEKGRVLGTLKSGLSLARKALRYPMPRAT